MPPPPPKYLGEEENDIIYRRRKRKYVMEGDGSLETLIYEIINFFTVSILNLQV